MRITVIRFFFWPSANMNFHELHMRSALPLATNGTQELLMNYYMEHYMGHYMCITCSVADKNPFVWTETNARNARNCFTNEHNFMPITGKIMRITVIRFLFCLRRYVNIHEWT